MLDHPRDITFHALFLDAFYARVTITHTHTYTKITRLKNRNRERNVTKKNVLIKSGKKIIFYVPPKNKMLVFTCRPADSLATPLSGYHYTRDVWNAPTYTPSPHNSPIYDWAKLLSMRRIKSGCPPGKISSFKNYMLSTLFFPFWISSFYYSPYAFVKIRTIFL